MGKAISIDAAINKIHSTISPNIEMDIKNNCIVLEGELDDWGSVVIAGKIAAKVQGYYGVLNNIKLKGHIPKMNIPSIIDKKYDGNKTDVLIIGAGVVGCSIARELSKYELDIMLLDKEYDVAMAASSRNDGEVHPGIDLSPGCNKLYYNGIGNSMYDKLCEDLGVKFARRGQVILFSKWWERAIGFGFKIKAKMNKIPNTKIVSRKGMKKLEPDLPKWQKGGFFTGTAGCVSPYKLTVALAENAVSNGTKICLNTVVTDMKIENKNIVSVSTNRGVIYPKVVVNASGVYSDIIAEMAGDRTFTIHPRKGNLIILDKKSQKNIVRTVMAKSPIGDLKNAARNSKGGGLIHTIDDNVLVGPNAIEIPDREDVSTEMSSINEIMQKQMQVAPNLKYSDIITFFSGVRAPTYEENFVVRKGIFTDNIVQAAGIQSPGLTAAPAIAVDIAKFTLEILGGAKPNKSFNPKREAMPHLNELSPEERDSLIKKNPNYGTIICRCEEISKGEIIDALNAPFVVPSVDAIKRRTRAGMGRCQGGFCGPLVVNIIAEHLGIPKEEVCKGNSDSIILYGPTKEGK